MGSYFWLWAGFGGVVLVMLGLDLLVFHRKAHEVGLREAARWSLVWIALALLFSGAIFFWLGPQKGLAFLTGYLIEKSLSLDNIFAWLVIFSDFGVPSKYRHRVLFYGILGALVARGAFIATGVSLLNTFHWIVYLFGAFLVFTSIRLALRKDGEIQAQQNPVLRLARRFLPISLEYDGQKFFFKKDGKWLATPLLLVLLAVESTDLVFALDSVPAVLAVTRDPFIVYTSNVFAILGLRALFFLLADVLHHFRYLKFGLALVLGFVGVKMLVSTFFEVPVILSLGVIAGILGASIAGSYLVTRWQSSARVGQ